jgi:hypothetical protein
MSVTVVRYTVKPDRVQENAELVRAVYAELAEREPGGFRYTTSILDDGVTFVHVGITDEGVESPLPTVAAFKRFTESIGERCDVPPQASTSASIVGSYRL